MSLLTQVTSFANMIASANRIHKVIRDEEGQMGAEYIGAKVIETFPNGSKHEAIIKQVEWCPSCLTNGNWLIYIEYVNDDLFIGGAWVSKEVLTLKDAE